jgi:hypothetical protein
LSHKTFCKLPTKNDKSITFETKLCLLLHNPRWVENKKHRKKTHPSKM